MQHEKTKPAHFALDHRFASRSCFVFSVLWLSVTALERDVPNATMSILVIAEGEEEGGAFQVAKKLKRMSGNEYSVIVLGHL